MTQEEILEGNHLILEYLYKSKRINYNTFDLNALSLCGQRFDLSWDLLHMVIDEINGLGKEFSFAIFKTYVSLTIEKGGKFYKDFSFAHAEYITSEQTGKEAAFKLIVKFIKWQSEKKLENN